MTSQWVTLNAADGGKFDAYLALPPAGKGPGLVLFEEIFGVNRHIRAVADQYALAGFVVMAPDMFWRQEPHMELGYEGADREKAVAAMKSADPAKLIEDIGATVKALRARPELSGGKVAALGFCMGGRLAYQAAATAGVDAAVCLYGGGIQGDLGRVANIKVPMQFHYGEKDAGIPMDAVEKVKAAFKGKNAEFFVYPDAQHGFNCWDRASYQAKASALSHGRALAFLAQNLY